MTEPKQFLRVLNNSPEAQEFDLVSELFHRVNRLIPPEQKVLTLSPDCPVRTAIDLMLQHGYSQIPVVTNGQVLGVFSFRSYAKESANFTIEECNREKCAPGDLTVGDCFEQLQYTRVNEEMSSVIKTMNRDDSILVGTPERLIGILTTMDFVRYLYEIASPFVMISEIELSLRKLIGIALTPEGFVQAAETCLSKIYGKGNAPTDLDNMTFDNYKTLIENGETWPLFAPIFGGHRARTACKLKEIGIIRNDLFHFKREITIEDHQTLANHRNWLLSKVQIHATAGRSTNEEN